MSLFSGPFLLTYLFWYPLFPIYFDLFRYLFNQQLYKQQKSPPRFGPASLPQQAQRNSNPSNRIDPRRASAKFAGRQKVHVSNKFGFTRYTKKDGPELIHPDKMGESSCLFRLESKK